MANINECHFSCVHGWHLLERTVLALGWPDPCERAGVRAAENVPRNILEWPCVLNLLAAKLIRVGVLCLS